MVESPEFKREMAELQKRIKEMDLPRLTAQIDQRALAEVQAHLGEIQARVGELQSEFGRQQGKFGEQQGKLGEQQGKLGEQQALLGEQQRKIIEEVRRQLKPIIEQAIRDGKGNAARQTDGALNVSPRVRPCLQDRPSRSCRRIPVAGVAQSAWCQTAVAIPAVGSSRRCGLGPKRLAMGLKPGLCPQIMM